MLKILNLTAFLLFMVSFCFGQNGWFVVTPSGDRLAWVEADEISPAGDMIKIKKNGKYGLMDINGNIKIKPKYSDIKGESNGLICVKATNGKYGYMTTKGYFPIEAKYTDASNFGTDDIAAVKNRGEWGFIDRRGKLLVDYQYAEATPFKNGYSIVRRLMSKTSGIINTQGRYVVDNKKYLNVRFPSDGLVAARSQGGGKWGFVDLNGRTVVQHQYEKVTQFGDGHALVSVNGSKFSVIDKRGNEVAPAMFDNAKMEGYNDGLAAVVYEGKWGFVNTKGEIVIPFEYEEVTSFSEGKAAVLMDGYWGYVDTAGEFAVLPEFEQAGAFYKLKGRPVALAKEGDMPPLEEEDGEYTDEEATIVDEVNEEEDEEMVEEEGNWDEPEEEYEEVEYEEEEYEEEEPVRERPSIFTRPSKGKKGKGKTKGKGKSKSTRPTLPPTGSRPSTKPGRPTGKSTGGQAEMKFAETMYKIKQNLNNARFSYTAALIYVNDGHAGGVETLTKNTKYARAEMNKALSELESAVQQVDRLSRSTGIRCSGMDRLLQAANADLREVRSVLREASGHLDDVFSKLGRRAFGKSIKETSEKLYDVQDALNSVSGTLEGCLTD